MASELLIAFWISWLRGLVACKQTRAKNAQSYLSRSWQRGFPTSNKSGEGKESDEGEITNLAFVGGRRQVEASCRIEESGLELNCMSLHGDADKLYESRRWCRQY